ncbi:MAG TPA: AAA family ATPase [Thermoanaerobaculia bacterium]|nr:AAA family ATPase [Thermoanaerobaculia bacterium]
MEESRPQSPPRIERLHVERYRALRSLDLVSLTPLVAFLGPNGSGKSTILDVFGFLAECFSSGLRQAWDKRGRFRELRTRGTEGPIVIELDYREGLGLPLLTYHLEIEEGTGGPFVAREWLSAAGSPSLLDFRSGAGVVLDGETAESHGELTEERLSSPEAIAVNTLGQLYRYRRIGALRRFISDWHLSALSPDDGRAAAETGPQERLSASGDNLPNVIEYLGEQHPEQLATILAALVRCVPGLERVGTELTPDGRLSLLVKDAPFADPIPARFASEGTMKLLTYLTLLYDPDPPRLIGIEEPESHLHPRLLDELAEECRQASVRTQLLTSTHSPFFVNGLRAEEVWALARDEKGWTQARRASEIRGISEFLAEGALLGDLWVEGHFDAEIASRLAP